MPSTIDLRDLVSSTFSHPVATAGTVRDVIVTNVTQNWPVIAVSTVAFLAARAGLRRARGRAAQAARSTNRTAKRRAATLSLAGSIASVTLWVAYLGVLLGQSGITLSTETTGLLIGAGGVAVALATQTIVRDLLAGWYVLAEDQYGVGDYIDLGFGFAGVVQSIGLRTTRLRSADGTIWHVRHSDVTKTGNRTQSTGAVLLDVTFTPVDEHLPTPGEVDAWTSLMVDAAVRLRSTLAGARQVASFETPTAAAVSDVADVVPVLVPNLSVDTLTTMAAIADDPAPVFTTDLDAVRDALVRAPAGTTPVLRDIEALGLVTSTTSSVTVRLRVRLAEQASRSYATRLLTRAIFDTVAPSGVAVGFSDVAEGDVIH